MANECKRCAELEAEVARLRRQRHYSERVVSTGSNPVGCTKYGYISVYSV